MDSELCILGAFDRFNYGDLLFSRVLKDKIENKFDLKDLKFFAVIENDYQNLGGVSSKNYNAMFNGNQNAHKSIIIAGGEVLAVPWCIIYSYLYENFNFAFFVRVLRKIFGTSLVDKAFMIIKKHQDPLPFVLSLKNRPNTKIAYNAVGGSDIKHLSKKQKNYLTQCLTQASYISVRDSITLDSLKELSSNLEIDLVPDSAIIISELYSKEFLKVNISSDILDVIEKNKGNYICFQSARSYIKDKEDIIADEFTKIHKQTGLNIVLFPIGLAAGHEDDYIITKTQKKLGNKDFMHYINKPDISIFDIMAIVAFSKLYAGTSLHGYITATSYAINRVGLHPKLKKLINFAKTWDVPEQFTGIEYNDLCETIVKALNVNKKDLENTRKNLINTYEISFQKMITAISFN